MFVYEINNSSRKRKRFDTTIVKANVLFLQINQCLFGRAVATTQGQNCLFVKFRILNFCFRHERARCFPFAKQAIDYILVFCGIFGIATVLGVSRSACEVGPFWVYPRQGSIRDTIFIDIEVTMEFLHLFELCGAKNFTSVRNVALVPFQIRAHPIVHPNIQIGKNHNRRLQTFC